MKRTKTMIAVVLLFALLLSSCGMAAPYPAETAARPAEKTEKAPPEAAAETAAAEPAAPETISASREAPAGEGSLQRPAAADTKVAPVSVKNAVFGAKFEGREVEGSGQAVDGVYRFTAGKTDGEAWHVKLEGNYPTVAGRDYRVTYRFRSDVAGKVKFGDFQEFEIQKGDNSVTGVLIATGGISYMDLQLGMLPPFTIDFSEIEVEEFADDVEYEDALSSPVNFAKETAVYEKHDQGYATILDRSGDGVSVNYVACSWESGIWKSRLYVKTGFTPEPGTRYHITADVGCDQDLSFELLFNNGDEEKGYGALYGQSVSAGETTGCEAVITGSGEGEDLVLQFSLGAAEEGCTVKVGNLRIEKIIDHYNNALPALFALNTSVATGNTLYGAIPVSFKDVPLNSFSYSGVDSVYEGHDDGYVVSLTENADSAVYAITQAPADPADRGVWKAKLYAATGVTLEAQTSYRVSFDLTPARDQAEYEVCFDGEYENAYGTPLFNRSFTAGVTEHFEQLITPEESHGALTLRFQLGKTDTAQGNTVTLSGLDVEKLDPSYEQLGSVSLSTGAAGNVSEEHYDGVEQTLSVSGGSATLNVSSGRGDGEGGVWSSKLLIKTGIVPEAGEKYRVSAAVDATADTGVFEFLYQNSGSDALYGGLKGLSGPGTYGSEFTAPASGCGELVLLFQLGDAAADNTITVSDLQVCRIEAETTENVALPGFAYPVSGVEAVIENSFSLETNGDAAATLTGDGSSATATVTASGDDWHVKLYAKPGMELEAGQLYTVSMDVTGADGCTVSYKNTAVDGEEGFGSEKIASGAVTHNILPSVSGTLEIILKIGNVSAGTAVTVSNLRIEKTEMNSTPVTLTGFAYPVTGVEAVVENSFALETNGDAAATLTGDGSSATATVTAPGDDWHVKLYAKPGMELESGANYTVSMDVAGADGCTVSFKNTAVEGEEGFGSETVASGAVSHTFTPSVSGTLEIILKIGSVSAGTAVTVSNLRIEKNTTSDTPLALTGFAYPTVGEGSTVNNNFSLFVNETAGAALTGDGSSATATVTAPGTEAWHVKLYAQPGLELEAGETYTISMKAAGADGCKANFKNNAVEGEDGFGSETVASGAVSHTVTPTTAGTLEIVLEIGTLAADSAVTVSELKITKTSPEVPVTLSGFAYPTMTATEASDGSFGKDGDATIKSAGAGAATATVNTQGADWSVKFYVKPGKALESGKLYRVSVNVAGANGCQLCFKNLGVSGDAAETAYGDLWLSSDNQTVTRDIAGTGGVMEIFVKIGALAAGSEVTLSGVKIEEYANLDLSGTTYFLEFNAQGGGTAGSGSYDGNSFTITSQPSPLGDGASWLTKFFVKPGVEMQSGKRYRVSFTLASPHDHFDVGFMTRDPYNEEAYGAGWYQTNQLITKEIDGDGHVLEILVKAAYAPANSTTTVSGLVITNLSETTDVTPAITAPTPASETVNPASFELSTSGAAAATLSGDGSSATATITASGEEGNVLLCAKTDAELKADTEYRISMKVTGANGCKVCYKDTVAGQEDGFGTETVSSETVTHTVTPTADGKLQILLKLGALAADSAVTVSNIQITENSTGEVDVTPSFAYPVTSAESVEPKSFELNTAGAAAAMLGGNGNSATATVVTPGDDWHIQLYAKTDLKLAAGKNYRVSMKVTGANGCTVFYKDTVADKEDGFGTETVSSETVTHTVTPAADGNLQILLKLGTLSEGSVVTVSDIQAFEYTTTGEDITPSDFAYPEVTQDGVDKKSFDLEANSGAAATLTGDGSSATATVTKPGEDWNVKLYAKPGVELEAGKNYQISMKVTGAEGCAVSYKDTAADKEDGFGTETVASETVVHTVTPESAGVLEILLKIGALSEGSTVTVSNVEISEYTTEGEDATPSDFAYPELTQDGVDKKSFDLETSEGAAATLTGDGSSATAAVTKSGDDWHIKLYAKPGVKLEAGETYIVSMKVAGAEGCTAAYKNTATGEEDGFGTETVSSGTVSHTVTPQSAGVLEILLKIGAVPAGTEVTVSEVTISKRSGETLGENLMPSELSAATNGNVSFWAHEDYAATLSGDGSAASLAITASPDEGAESWKVKLFAETGITLEKGKQYRISADVSADAETDYEICYNNGAEELAVGGLFGLHASAETGKAVFEVTATEAAELVLQFNLGLASAPCTVTISSITVEEMTDDSAEDLLPSFSYNSVGSFSSAADDGYIVSLDRGASSDTFCIHHAPAERNPWNVKLNIRMGFTPEKDKGYRVSFDLKAARPQSSFELFLDGDSEGAYGQFYGMSLASGGNSISQLIMPGDSKGELVLQLRLGQTDDTDGNTYVISNVKLEEVTFRYTQTPEMKDVTTLVTQNGYTEHLEKTRDRATVRIEKTPAEGREPWKSKLFVQTGVTLKAGQKYRVSMEVKSIIPAPFEVCFNNGNEEKGLGAMFGLISTPSGQYVEYVTYAKQDTQLVIQLSLGNCSAPNSIILSGVKVEKAGDIFPVSDTIYTF